MLFYADQTVLFRPTNQLLHNKETRTIIELKVLNFIFLFPMLRMAYMAIYHASSKFKCQILSYKQDTDCV